MAQTSVNGSAIASGQPTKRHCDGSARQQPDPWACSGCVPVRGVILAIQHTGQMERHVHTHNIYAPVAFLFTIAPPRLYGTIISSQLHQPVSILGIAAATCAAVRWDKTGSGRRVEGVRIANNVNSLSSTGP